MTGKIQRYDYDPSGYMRDRGGHGDDWLPVDDGPVCLSSDVAALEAENLAMRCCGNCAEYKKGIVRMGATSWTVYKCKTKYADGSGTCDDWKPNKPLATVDDRR